MSELMENANLAFLSKRRSVKADRLTEPGPSADELQTMLTIAARVPDHKRLVPWRFIVLEGDARAKLGETIAEACREQEPEPLSEMRLATERGRLARAPLVVAVVSRAQPLKSVPEWEQILSAGAAAFSLCLAANALGYGTIWLTEWYAYNDRVCAALGLADHERVVGFVHIGTPKEPPDERERPNMSEIVTRWQG